MKGLLVVAIGVSLAVQQSRDAQVARPPQTGTASVTGRVVAAPDGRPLRRVQILLRDADTATAGGRLAVTNDNGQFEFRHLPAGRFHLTASKPAYLTMSSGMKKPARPGGATTGSAIVLAEGQPLTVNFTLTRGGVVSGVIREPSGAPANAVRVGALAYVRTGNADERSLVPVGEGNSVTDERGMYRIYGLPPGEYLVGVPSVSLGSLDLGVLTDTELRRADGLLRAGVPPPGPPPSVPMRPKTIGFVPVYHPGATAVNDATLVTLGPGEERNDVDVHLRFASTARLTGSVTHADGRPAQSVLVRLATRSETDARMTGLSVSGATDAQGRYALYGLAPGAYVAAVRTSAPGGDRNVLSLWAQADVTVNGEDLEHDFRLQPGSTVSGRVIFDAVRPPPDQTRLEVLLTPDRANAPGLGGAVAIADAAGRFSMTGVMPGRYRLTIAGNGQAWSIIRGTVGGADALDRVFEVRPQEDVADAAITLTDRVTEVTGRVIDASGAPVPDYTVIIFPADESLWAQALARRIQGLRPAQDGRFTFRGIAAGDYLIGAADDVERGDWLDPAFLKSLAAGGTVKVTVVEGRKTEQEIRVR